MYIDGKNYRLTKHGRSRFLRRVYHRYPLTDEDIIRIAVAGLVGYKFIWQRDRDIGGYRLVTVLFDDVPAHKRKNRKGKRRDSWK